MRRQSEKYAVKGSKYANRIGLYLSFHLNWVLGPFVHGRLQNLQTSEVTFAHFITPLTIPDTITDCSIGIHTELKFLFKTGCKCFYREWLYIRWQYCYWDLSF